MNRKFIYDSNCVLRSVLNKKENIDILKDFIEAILDISISKISLKNNIMYDELFDKNTGISNSTIVTDEGEEFNIGIQIIDGYYIQNKMFLYYAQLYNSSVKTITINIIDSEYLKSDDYYEIIKVKDFDMDSFPKQENTGEIHVLELPKFKDSKIDTKEKAWISYFKENNINEEIIKKYKKIAKLDSCLDEYWKEERL